MGRLGTGRKIIEGEKFNRLTVVKQVGIKRTSRIVECKCDSNVWIEHLGETKTISQWAKIYNTPQNILRDRLSRCEWNLDIYNFKWKHDFLYLKEAV